MGLFSSREQSIAPKALPPQPEKALPPENGKGEPSIPSSQPGLSANRAIDWRVLFVGGSPLWFHQIERDILCLQPNWLCQRVETVAQAQAVLESASFDAAVLDRQISDQTDRLSELEKSIKRIICLVRCNMSDRSTVGRWHRIGLTPVSEDGDAAVLVAGLKRARSLRDWMADPAIRKLLPHLHKLPAAPRLHAEVSEQLRSPNSSISVLARLISQDPVMSAKILQVANSTFFGLAYEVTDTAEAVMILGTERIRSLILLVGVFSQYAESKCPGLSLELVWGHSVQVGLFARSITFAETKDARMAEAAFTAGLLHDIGKLILVGNVPETYEAVRQLQASEQLSPREAELKLLGTTHAELGACLLATWGLPLPILEAIAWHHEPLKSASKGFSLLAAVHAANVFAQECGQGSGEGMRDSINLEFLLRIGMSDCRNRWREFCGITDKPETGTQQNRLVQREEAKQN
jgi:HD-like signal output (HDOD) protein